MRDKIKKAAYDAARYAELRQEKRAYMAAYYLANRQKLIENQRVYRAEHPEEIKARKRAYNSTHKQELRAYFRGYAPEYNRHRRATDPEFRILENLRRRVHKAIKQGWKTGPTLDLIGCTIMEWRAHLEKQFRPGMTWENYGPVWHIDHKKPCASFDLLDPAQQRSCFNWSNTQPLFAVENMRKGAR